MNLRPNRTATSDSTTNPTNCVCHTQNVVSAPTASEMVPITKAEMPNQRKKVPGARISSPISRRARIHQFHGPRSRIIVMIMVIRLQSRSTRERWV